MTDTTTNDAAGWEELCRQCGRCCQERLEDGRGKLIYTENACRYLDAVTRRCTIYARRFEINPHCIKLTPELVPIFKGLPPDCGYRPPAAKFTRKDNRDRRKRRG